jgi:AdoMet-dependent rRNA methyltransferase SPB1
MSFFILCAKEAGEDEDIVQSKYDSDEDQDLQEANPLMVPLNDGAGPTQEEIANMWFSQDVFAEAVEEGGFEKDDSETEMDIDGLKEKTPVAKKIKENKPVAEKIKENKPVAEKIKQNSTAASMEIDHTKSQASKELDFEIVPAPATDSDDSSSDESE